MEPVDGKSVALKHRPGLSAVVSAAVAATAGAIVVAQTVARGGAGHGGALPIVVGGLILAAGVWLFFRGLRDRRRARMAAIAALLPGMGRRRRGWSVDDDIDSAFLLDDCEGGDDFSENLPAARAEIRAATRALLGALEEDMRRDGTGKRRSTRPGCRRARLRTAGRSEAKRRHPRVRAATYLS